jgi:hypothetical protein
MKLIPLIGRIFFSLVFLQMGGFADYLLWIRPAESTAEDLPQASFAGQHASKAYGD